MKFNKKLFLLTIVGLFVSLGCSAAETGKRTIKADVYADNWFALYAANELIKDDSVAYKTEKSFNAESFSFEVALPAQLNFVIRDYIEDDSGLEYIGSSRQQIGDGGFMAQFFDAETEELLAVSNDEWRCKAIHQAPLNKSCVRSSNPQSDCESIIDSEPDGWMSPDFDDIDWPHAVAHSAQEVRPLGGFHQVSWQPTAELIWTEDLETDNWLLCRFTLAAPK